MDPRRHPLHRHAEARLVIFTAGDYVERAFEERARFRAGDFVVRPAFFAHDGAPGEASDYVRLPLSRAASARYFSKHGWTARRGAVSATDVARFVSDSGSGDALLAGPSFPIEIARARTATDRVASALSLPVEVALADLAEEERLRPWELTRAFLREHNITPSRFRQEARVQRALKLLAETDAEMRTVAHDCGYSDQSHMTRAFQTYLGTTPTLARRSVCAF